jgi:hypothetical protein
VKPLDRSAARGLEIGRETGRGIRVGQEDGEVEDMLVVIGLSAFGPCLLA